jgi:hypothetical protein
LREKPKLTVGVEVDRAKVLGCAKDFLAAAQEGKIRTCCLIWEDSETGELKTRYVTMSGWRLAGMLQCVIQGVLSEYD